MLAIENRNGLLCTYNTETRDFRDFDDPRDLRRHLDESGVEVVLYQPDGSWSLPSYAGDDSRKSAFRHAAGTSATKYRAAGTDKPRCWVEIPVTWVNDGRDIAPRARALRTKVPFRPFAD